MVEKENILTRVHDKGLEAKAPIKQQQQQQRQQQQIAVKTDLYYTNLNKVEQSITDDQRRELEMLQLHRDCSNFLSVAQIYLDSNALLREPLQVEHIKSRLLGHFGTCPGINLVYGHCNYLIRKHEDLDMFLVVGPGHGAPAVLANLYLEGSLHAYYPKYTFNEVGVNALARDFSRYGGFPSHLNPMLPGTIHEGGELGYALGVSFGAVLNNPDLIVTCIVGDGECETGPTATAWHAHKFIDPKASGAVIPIVHLNGFKISSRTLYGTMSDEDLIHLFIGYGYQPRIVGNDMSRIDLDMADSMEWALGEIRNIQKAAREGNPIFQPRWPMIIMKTPKGWTGIKELHHLQIEGSFRSHQVPAPNVTEDEEEFAALEKWLRSYNIDKLFDEKGAVRKEIRNTCPKKHRRMGCNHHTRSEFQPLTLPDIRKFAVDVTSANRGKQTLSATQNGGKYLAELWELNQQRFKIFSPDELASNKLDAILKVSNRNFQWDKATAFKDGGVIEILSEHTCQALLQGYILTGRYGIFPSYEAFLGIIGTMMTQFAKFMKISSEVVWRNPIPSLTYIESSTLWRQEHNGFSHQNPGFINTLINMKADIVRVYLPPDANCFLSTINHCMRGKDYINLVISTKNDTSTWLTMDEAIKHCRAGASVWKWAGNEDENYDPDVVLVGIGNEVTTEIVAAARLLIKYVPGITVRVVNVTDLMILETKSLHPHGLSDTMFNSLFTANKPVIVNFHGYPSAIKQLLFGRKHVGRFCILGYQEEGTTTTPFHMLTSNKASRFDICIEAIRAVTPHNPKVAINATAKVAGFQHVLREHHEYILKHNADPPGLAEIMNPINRHVDF